MAEPQNQGMPPAGNDAGNVQPAPRKKKRWGRRILIGLGVVVVLLVILVALAPTIISTATVRRVVIGKVNDSLNGKVSMADWSIGWSSGVEVRGLEVKDEAGNVILSAPRVFTGLSLIEAAKGNFDLGTTILENPTFHLVIDEDGKLNLSKLAKPSIQTPSKSGSEGEKSALPNVKGTIKIENPTGTVVAAGIAEVLTLNGGSITIQIPSLDGQITDEIKLLCAVGDRPEGTIALAGTVNLLEKGEFNPQALKADQKLTIQKLDTAAVTPFLKLAGVDLKLAGMTDGQLAVKVDGLNNLSADGEINIADLSATGRVLHGDTFATRSLVIPIQASRVFGQLKANVGVRMDAGKVAVVVDAPESALKQVGPLIVDAVMATLNGGVSANQRVAAIAGDGRVELSADLDAASIANQLPNTIQLTDGTKLTSGRLSHQSTIRIADGVAKLASSTELTNTAGVVRGRNGSLQPVTLDAALTATGGAKPELKEIQLTLASGFANLKADGPTLQQINVTGKMDLAHLQKEVGQFVQLDAYLAPVLGNLRGEKIEVEAGQSKLNLAGIIDLSAGSSGDLMKSEGKLQTFAQLTVNNLQITGLGERYDINEPGVVLAYSGAMERGEGGDAPKEAINAIRDAILILKLGPQNNPTVDLTASADVSINPFALPQWQVKGLRISLGEVQNELGPVLSALDRAGLRFEGGQLLATGGGTYGTDGVTFKDLQVNPVGVALAKVEEGQRRPLLENFSFKLDTAGQVKLDDGLDVQLSQFVVDSPGLLHLQKVGDADLFVKMARGGSIQPGGKVQLAADLGKLNSMLQKMNAGEVVAKNKTGELRSGNLAGVVEVGGGSQLALSADMEITHLGITTPSKPIENETISLAFKGLANRDFSTVQADTLTIRSSFANATVADARLLLKNPDGESVPTMKMVQQARVAVDVADLSRLQGLIDAFSAPAVQDPALGSPAPALLVQRGSMSIQATVSQQGDSTVIDLLPKAENVVLMRGEGSYALKPVDLKAALALTDTQWRITQLDGSAGVAAVSLPAPIVINHADGKLSASGAIHVNGELVELSQLMDLLQGRPSTDPPYLGKFDLKQNLSTDGDAISLRGDLRIADFRVRDEGREVFNEKRVTLANDLELDPRARNINFRNVSLEMPNSKALALKLTGKIEQYDTQRTFDDVQADLTYDLSKIWSLLQPMMSRPGEKNDLVVAGTASRSFRINGSYPADLPFNQAIHSLKATGSIAVAKLETKGLTFEDLDLPILLKDGKLTFESAIDVAALQKKPLASCNGGTVDLSGIVIDLSQEHPRISTPKDHILIHRMRLNPVLANTALGDITPLFADPKQVNGVVDLTIVECDQLPLDNLLTQQSHTNTGRAEVLLSVTELNIVNQFANFMLGIFDQRALAGQGLQGNIKDARITLEGGVATQNLVFELGRYPLAFNGKVGLANQRFMPMNITLPPTLLRMIDKNLIKYLPEGIAIPITGTTHNFQIQIEQVIPNLLAEAGKRALIESLGGNRNNRDDKEQANPNGRKKDDNNPLGGLEELLRGDKKNNR
ncbi:MAG: hypothetical protein IT447_02730 [Phycisphaerales bacterium]|nr:hypothetical protein [Phycisphaerales bacterium]